MKKSIQLFCLICVGLYGTCAFGATVEERLNALEETVSKQSETIKEQKAIIEQLRHVQEDRPTAEVKVQEETRPVAEAIPVEEAKPLGGISGFFGGSVLTNPNISLVLDTYGYVSNLNDRELENRGIPGYTANGLEQRNGANLRAVELSLFAPVDPYFNLYANLPVNEDGIELEEAYAVTTSLPAGLQLKGGKFKSNFSRLDAQHSHAWDFADIALPYRAFFGNEGLGGDKGIQFTYLSVAARSMPCLAPRHSRETTTSPVRCRRQNRSPCIHPL